MGIAAALPTYVQALRIPEKRDTLPLLIKRFGTTVISIRLMPCIFATSTAIRTMEMMGDLSSNTNIRHMIMESIAENANIIAAQNTSFFRSLR